MTSNTNNQWQDINKMYPYGEFPIKYTKKCKEADINNPNIFNYTNHQFSQSQNIDVTAQKYNQTPARNSNIDIAKILPIITSLKDKKEMKSQDMLNLLLPLLIGPKSKELAPLLKLLSPSEKKVESQQLTNSTTKITPPKYPAIDSLKRID